MPIKIAINGFGRIGRASFRAGFEDSDLEIVAINDLAEPESLVHLLKYDSVYGQYNHLIKAEENVLLIGHKKIPVFKETDPGNLPWEELDVDVVLESSGHFLEKQKAKKHLQAGARKVVISAPPKDKEIPTFIFGVNHKKIDFKKDLIISNGSCTTNCLAPIVKILNDNFGIKQGMMTTIHSYTNDQNLVDSPHKDLRRARTAGENIIPTTTGATKSVIDVMPSLAGKLTGLAVRVPTPIVSLVDLVCFLEKAITAKEINDKFKEAAMQELKGILDITEEPLVSSDFIANPYSAVVDLSLTKASNHLAKIIAWYDNEYGYACRYVEMAKYIGRKN
ncbi:MAG: type I glyceraldehyde-3-phosphate dehydrogenase [Patescibacteria group bacterium]|nr:type I glyceraldehyde-3-phosphate dehydrogenase [Patescibacteria group bacterium]MDD5172864.1 type I glyceraldehyde-3-phosphate dehydrogenase [Patescibacteria group bacterium]